MTQAGAPKLRVLSLGWGSQSMCLAAMSALGHLPRLDAAIHSDTGHEQPETYRFAQEWTPWLEERGIHVITVRPANNDLVRLGWGKGSVQIPAFTQGRDSGKTGQIKRQCTRNWKITPIRRETRRLLGNTRTRPGMVHAWMGITLDEWERQRTSDVKYIENIYPLVELRMTKADCISWLQDHGIAPPPKSACTFCPYHNINYWKQAKRQGGPRWEQILRADQQIRDTERKNLVFLHPSRKRMQDAVRIPEDYGAEQMQMDLPCDGGLCFV